MSLFFQKYIETVTQHLFMIIAKECNKSTQHLSKLQYANSNFAAVVKKSKY